MFVAGSSFVPGPLKVSFVVLRTLSIIDDHFLVVVCI